MTPETQISVGFTGTREGMSDLQRESLRALLEGLSSRFKWFHHGCCKGADWEAQQIARELGYLIAGHPPVDKKAAIVANIDYLYPEADYLTRDRSIVDCSVTLLAAPATMAERLRSGTWYTVRYARKLNRSVTILARK